MDARDRDAIATLFTKLRDVEREAGPRDGEAERLIRDEIARNPGAAYYMAQTVVMQDMALNRLNADMEALKRQMEELRHAGPPGEERREEGGFLSRILGGGEPARTSVPRTGDARSAGPWGQSAAGQSGGYAQPGYGQPQGYPQQGYAQPPQGYPQGQGYPQSQYAAPGGAFGRMGGGGGGFLAGAAQTAMGVAGGVVLGNAIGSMFGHGGGLFGGGTPDVQETVNVFEAPQDAVPQDAFDPGDTYESGPQDVSFDDDGGGWGESQDV